MANELQAASAGPDPRAQANEGAEEASDGHEAEENDHGGLASCP